MNVVALRLDKCEIFKSERNLTETDNLDDEDGFEVSVRGRMKGIV